MAKLYAEIASDKGGRVVGKGGNEYVSVLLRNGNRPVLDLRLTKEGITLCDYSDGIYHNLETLIDTYHERIEENQHS